MSDPSPDDSSYFLLRQNIFLKVEGLAFPAIREKQFVNLQDMNQHEQGKLKWPKN